MKLKGFTLIEVLVVIAVIAVLIAIAMPSLQKARHKGHDVLCRNNLREIHRAVTIYTDDNQSYPYGFISCQYNNNIGNASKDWQRGMWWFQFLEDFHNEEKNPTNITQLWCPANQNKDPRIAYNVLCNNYGLNYGICRITLGSDPEFSGEPFKPPQIKHASSRLLAMDSGYTLASWKMFAPDTATYPFEAAKRQDAFYAPGWPGNEQRSIDESLYDDAISGRHGKQKVNAAFLDGHVDDQPTADLEPIFDDQGIITKRSVWAP